MHISLKSKHPVSRKYGKKKQCQQQAWENMIRKNKTELGKVCPSVPLQRLLDLGKAISHGKITLVY